MTFSRHGLATTTQDFQALVARRIFGTPAGEGWATYTGLYCEICECVWTTEAKIGTRGRQCVCCGHYDPNWVWGECELEIGWEGSHLAPVGWTHATICPN